MRHPAAPTIIAILLGFLVIVVVFHYCVDYGHHEGNPRVEDLPKRVDEDEADGTDADGGVGKADDYSPPLKA
jgi:hypothetical protein